MSPVVFTALASAAVTLIGSFLALLGLSYAGTGFGYGDLRRDLLKLAAVSAVIGAVEAGWYFVPGYHWSFHALTVLAHTLLLRAFFLEEISMQEASMVAVATRVAFIYLAFASLATTA